MTHWRSGGHDPEVQLYITGNKHPMAAVEHLLLLCWVLGSIPHHGGGGWGAGGVGGGMGGGVQFQLFYIFQFCVIIFETFFAFRDLRNDKAGHGPINIGNMGVVYIWKINCQYGNLKITPILVINGWIPMYMSLV